MTSKEYDNAAEVKVRSLPLSIGPWRVSRPGNANNQTFTWLFSGEGSGDNGALFSGAQDFTRRGIQLALAQPQDERAPRRFDSFVPEPFTLLSFSGTSAGEARVFVGSLFGQTSPVETAYPAIGAELRIYPGAEFVFMVTPEFEHALLALSDGLVLENVPLETSTIGCTQQGVKTLHIVNDSEESALAILLGGERL